MKKYFDTVLRGNPLLPLPGATISVFLTGSDTLATVYLDDEVTPAANPMTADSTGYFAFKAPAGTYDLVFAYSDEVLKRINQVSFDGFDASNVHITGGTIDGVVIGGSTPAEGSFTDLDYSGELSGGGV